MRDLKEALMDALWYNGLNAEVIKWADCKPDQYKRITFEDQYNWKNMDDGDGQLQLVWMICVLMFGNYGTSPRFGWIEDVDGFRQFIKDICREDE